MGNISPKEVDYLSGGIPNVERILIVREENRLCHEEGCVNLLTISLCNKNIPQKAMFKYDSYNRTLKTLITPGP